MPTANPAFPRSIARRDELLNSTIVNDVTQSVAITFYYTLAWRTLAISEESLATAMAIKNQNPLEQARQRYSPLNQAYIYWKRLGNLSILVIPLHNYFGAPEFVREKKQLQKARRRSFDVLEDICQMMHEDEIILDAGRAREAADKGAREAADKRRSTLDRTRIVAEQRRQKAAEEAEKAAAAAALTPRRQAAEEEKAAAASIGDDELSEGDSVEYKGERGCVLKVHRDVQPSYYTVSLGDREVQTERSRLTRHGEAPPSYEQAAVKQDIGLYDFGPPLTSQLPQTEALGASLDPFENLGALSRASTSQRRQRPSSLCREMAAALKAEWATHLRNREASVEALPTVQGRSRDADGRDSTNGCAVIAPLACHQHITSKRPTGATNAEIGRVIDVSAPPIIAHIRMKHGLGDGAFIIPADVHDFLYDANAISRDMFQNVCGGDITNDKHVANLVDGLVNAPRNSLAAAAFFFHEHVVAILRVGSAFHFVDSMPGSEGMGTRTVCGNSEVLTCFIKYYATTKFTPRNQEYIDSRDWNDLDAEFDPRVFQSFIWCNPNDDATKNGAS